MELLELLSFYKFPGYDIPITCGSAMSALNGTNEEIEKNAILKLMDAVHLYIPDSVRVLDRSFLMPNEGIFSIQVTFLIRILHSLKHSGGQLETPLFIYVRTATWIKSRFEMLVVNSFFCS